MRLKEAWQTRGWVKLAAAVIINAVFLAFMLTCFAPVYETNDDLFLSNSSTVSSATGRYGCPTSTSCSPA